MYWADFPTLRVNSWDPSLHFTQCLRSQTPWLTAEICQCKMVWFTKHLRLCSTGPPKSAALWATSAQKAFVVSRLLLLLSLLWLIRPSCKSTLHFVLCSCRQGCGRPLVRWSEAVQLQPSWILLWHRWDSHISLLFTSHYPYNHIQ